MVLNGVQYGSIPAVWNAHQRNGFWVRQCKRHALLFFPHQWSLCSVSVLYSCLFFLRLKIQMRKENQNGSNGSMITWDDFGCRSDVVQMSFRMSFRSDILLCDRSKLKMAHEGWKWKTKQNIRRPRPTQGGARKGRRGTALLSADPGRTTTTTTTTTTESVENLSKNVVFSRISGDTLGSCLARFWN